MHRQFLNIDEVMRNTRKYWYIDGIAEIIGGLFVSLLAITYLLISAIEHVLTRSLAYALGQPLLILIGSFLINSIVTFLKQRLTYPRTGYLSYKKPEGTRRLSRKWKVLIMGAITGVVVGTLSSLIPERFLPVICAFFIALFSVYLGYYLGVPRFHIIACATLLLGGSISYWVPPSMIAFSALLGGIGCIWVLSGLYALLIYMRQTTPIQDRKI